MKKEFIVVLKKHRVSGYVLLPFFAKKYDGKEYLTLSESLVPEDIMLNPNNYSDVEKKITDIAAQYGDTVLFKKFSRNKKISPSDFLKTVDEKYFEDFIKPFIEKKVLEIIEICKINDIKIYFRDKTDNIFYDDEIFLSTQNADIVFNFLRDQNETRYFISIKHKDKKISLLKKSIYVLSNNPCVIVLSNKMFTFSNIDAKKLIPFTTKEYVSVQKRVESEYYKKFVFNIIKSGNFVNNIGFEIKDLDEKPRAVLTMETDWKNEIIFVLNFRYGNLSFLSDSPNHIVVDFINNDKEFYFTKLQRDLDYENAVESAAYEIFGSREKKGVFKINQSSLQDKSFQTSASINFINENLNRFAEAGIVLEQNSVQKKYYTGQIKLDINVRRKNDWFDIYAVVKLDGFEIPFINLRHYIVNNIYEYRLPDGSIVILPIEWFSKYSDLFVYGNFSQNGDYISLKDYQYQTLLQLPLNSIDNQRVKQLESDLANIGKLPSLLPSKVNATLRPYQVTAFNWLTMMKNHNFGAILADDMGLGKTLCTLSLLSESGLQEGEFQDGLFSFPKKIPSLLVVPKSLIYNWIAEAKKFVPSIKIMEYSGNNRTNAVKSFSLYDIIITSYGTLRNDTKILENQEFNYLILDESQTVKNPTSKTYLSLVELNCRHRLALTGTPIENSLIDLWAQINFINPGLLGNLVSFKKRFLTAIEKNSNDDAVMRLKKLVFPFILRRTKQQVLDDLPDLIEQTIFCEMSENQHEIYETEKSKIRNSIIDFMEKGVYEKSAVMVLQGLTKLRQIACNPTLFDEEYKGESSKTDEIMRVLQNIVSQNHKVLIFSAFVQHLQLIAKQLQQKDIDYCMLTGESENRSKIVEKFTDTDVPVFLISIKAGGTGLNLTQADYVFIIDPWWNPAVEQQAIARAHRIGQKSNVVVYRFITKDTVEEKIQKFQEKKSNLAETFVSENTLFSKESGKEILNLL